MRLFWSIHDESHIFISVHFYEGQTVTLTCSLSTKVVPSWVHPDNETINFQGFAFVSPLFQYKDKYRYTVLQNGSLMINATKASDAGSYVCVSGTEKETLHLLIAGENHILIQNS